MAIKVESRLEHFVFNAVTQTLDKMKLPSDVQRWEEYGVVTEESSKKVEISLPVGLSVGGDCLRNHLKFLKGVEMTFNRK